MYIEFLNNEKFPKKNADIADNPEAFTDAGYLLKEHELVVDIDNIEKDVLHKIISLFNIKTQIVWTSRGAHFYFKKPQGFKGSRKVCPLGFEVEYKHISNTKHVAIKQNGKMRVIENEGVREDLPAIFYTRKKLEPLLGLDEHDGRNNKLFVHRMKISNIDNWKSILRFINNNIFAEPLPEEEFTTLSRDVKIEAKKDNEPEIADHLLHKYKMVLYSNKLYWYENGNYQTDEDRMKRLVFNEVGMQKTRYVDEIIRQVKYRAPIIDENQLFDIKLKNGILRNGEFLEVEYQDFTPYSIPLVVDFNAKPVQVVDDYINHLTNHEPEYRLRLLEIIAHTLIIDKEFKRALAKFFIFVGDGGNGKGTLLLIIRSILGAGNCSALSIKNMMDERYFSTVQGKLVNLGDDIQDEAINNEQMKILKNISTCDAIPIRNLFEQSRMFEPTFSLIFTSNHILKSFEKGEAYKRRVDWLPMYSKPTKKDVNFIKKLTTPEALKYWMRLIVEAYERLYKNQGFTHSPIVQQFNDDYHSENNNITEFLEDYTPEQFIGLRSPEAYELYTIWAEENGLNVLSNKQFKETLRKQMGLVIKKTNRNKKSVRIYGYVD